MIIQKVLSLAGVILFHLICMSGTELNLQILNGRIACLPGVGTKLLYPTSSYIDSCNIYIYMYVYIYS